MNRLFISFLFVSLLTSSLAGSLAMAKKALPPVPTDYIYNETKQISQQDERALSVLLKSFHEQSGKAMAVALFNSLEGEHIDDYTNTLYRNWCGPNKQSCDGLLLLISFEDRKYRTEVGYGLEGDITDVFTSRVQREILVPALREGNVAAGIAGVAQNYFQKLTGKPLQVSADFQQPKVAYKGPSLFWLAIFFFFFIMPLMKAFRYSMLGSRRHRRTGFGSALPFVFLPGGWGGSGRSGGGGGGGFGGFSGGGSGWSGGGGSSGSW